LLRGWRAGVGGVLVLVLVLVREILQNFFCAGVLVCRCAGVPV